MALAPLYPTWLGKPDEGGEQVYKLTAWALLRDHWDRPVNYQQT